MGRSADDNEKVDSPKVDSPESKAPGDNGPKRDVMLVHGKTANGNLKVIRAREDRVEFGSVSQLEEGKPIHGEVVRLKPRKDMPLICDVESQMDCRPAGTEPRANGDSGTTRPGPAQVASEAYRENWDRIWKRHATSELN